MEHGRAWSMAEHGAWQSMKHGRAWSMAEYREKHGEWSIV